MSQCQQLSDKMPAVALGRAEWSRSEVQHLDTCRSCREEWHLVGRSSRMGRELALGLEANSNSDALLQRLERGRMRRRRAWSWAGLATAASIAALVWTQRPAPRPMPTRAAVAGLQMSLPELDNLQPADLDSVLQTMDEPAPADSTLHELESFLDSWEG